ncbi:MAG: enoyl-CoA hydratase/isomerase family protein [Desertimonas sp.]
MTNHHDTHYTDIVWDEPRPGVARLTLNRPDRMNALGWHSHDELRDALGAMAPRVLVITGEGRAFCAGDDIQDIFNEGNAPPDMGDDPGLMETTALLMDAPYPIIAAVNGAAVGWGMDLALCADIRIASSHARFASLFVKRGQAADVPGLGRLWQLVGRERAARLLMTGDFVDADTSLDWGLVSEVVEPEKLMDTALRLADAIAANPPLAVAAIKAGLKRTSDPDWHEFGGWLGPIHARLFATNDHAEAVRAHLEGRTPTFTGT